MSRLRDIWEETSFELENYQTNPKCVAEERDGLKNRKTPKWRLSFDLSKVNLSKTLI